MTSIISIPGYFFKSSDLMNPSKVSKDISKLAGIAIPDIDQSVANTLKDAHKIIDNTNEFLQYINENPTGGKFGTTYANSLGTSATSSLDNLIGSNGNSYSSATSVFNLSDAALSAVLYSGKTNSTYNPADKIFNEVESASELIFSSTNCNNTEESTSQNQAASLIFGEVNAALDSILYTNANTNLYTNSGSATELVNSTNTSVDEVLNKDNGESSNVYCNSGSSSYIFGYVNSNLNSIFKTNNSQNNSIYANSGGSSSLLGYVNTKYDNIFNSNNGEDECVYTNSRESKELFDSVSSSVDSILGSNNGESSTVLCNSANSYQLMSAVNIALAQLFANPV